MIPVCGRCGYGVLPHELRGNRGESKDIPVCGCSAVGRPPVPVQLTESEVLARLADRVRDAGSLRQLGLRWNVGGNYIGQVLAGNRPVTEAILRGLGLRRIVVYEPTPVEALTE